ncbi:hypothetical protein Tsubulata_000051 [Turnera subulata]|uniref:Protein LURP-one-related 5-like n=1 Tax=Turnera subulata TaxID=218843 RepID=A0A9Q0J7M3_9ROSI|nr:hypothetical protein Tsubulata_000051 [Turnera subulata]
MSKIHPAENKCRPCLALKAVQEDHQGPTVLTVWKRSSMSFQGTDGFTVFDPHGRLVFRVDNYSRKNGYVAGNGLVLMDGVGNALLTLKPKAFSLQSQWNAFKEEGCGKNPKMTKVFSMRNPSVLHHCGKDVAEIFMGTQGHRHQTPDFRIQGSFKARNCKILTPDGNLAAKIHRKRVNTTILLSDDVFSLVVEPGFEPQLIMAFVIILDRISSAPYTPVLCSLG